MRRYGRIGAVLGLLCCSIGLFAQRTLEGRVTDAATREALFPVTVVLRALPDSATVAYGLTDSSGEYRISCPGKHAGYLLQVSCMGFKTCRIRVGEASRIDVAMHEDAVALQEVVVKERMAGAKVKKDTVEYNLKLYQDGTEQVLGDVLRKLPGIEVDEKGQVSANGKKVDKILVDGQDFLGEHNERLTRTLPSDMVQKVQLLNNYSDYSLLDGFTTRKQTVLNVGIDPDKRGRLTGNAEAGAGWEEKQRVKANLYSFGSKVMWGINGSYSNTGEEGMSLQDYIRLSGGVRNFAQSLSGTSGVIEEGTGVLPILNAGEECRERKNALLTANMAWNPSEAWKVNAYYLFNRKEDFYETAGVRTYLNTSVPDSRTDKEGQRRDDFHKLCVDVKGQPAASLSLHYRAVLLAMPSVERYDEEEEQLYRNEQQLHRMQLGQQFSLAHRMGSRHLLSLDVTHVWNKGSDRYALLDGTPLFDVGEEADRPQQKTSFSRHAVTLAASWRYRFLPRWVLKSGFFAGYRDHAVRAKGNSEAWEIPETHYRQSDTGVRLALQKNAGVFRMECAMNAAWLNSHFSGRRWVVTPDLSFSLEFSTVHSLSFSYRHTYRTYDDALFQTGSVVRDHRQVVRYAGCSEMLGFVRELQGIYHYFDVFSDVSVVAVAGMQAEADPMVCNYSVQGKGTAVSWMKGSKDAPVWYANLRLDKGFAVPLKWGIKASYRQTENQTGYEGILTGRRYQHWEVQTNLTSRFRALCNVELGAKASGTDYRIKALGRADDWYSYEAYVRPFLVVKERCQVELPLAYVADRSFVHDSYWRLNARASYTFGKKRWMCYVEGFNLLHWGDFQRITLTYAHDYIQKDYTSRMSGYLLAGVRMSF